jgi:hypothetical protein
MYIPLRYPRGLVNVPARRRFHQYLDLALVGLKTDERVGRVVEADDAGNDVIVTGRALGHVPEGGREFIWSVRDDIAQFYFLRDHDQGVDMVALHADTGHDDPRAGRGGERNGPQDAGRPDALEDQRAPGAIGDRI